MHITAFSDSVFYFLFFSFAGWLWDTLAYAIRYRRFANSGFLYGPYKPMYGFAGVALILLKSVLPISLPVFLLIAVAFFIIYDYAGSVLLEKLTNFQWWNYRDRKLQINGRVYLPKAIFYAVIFSLCVYYGGDWIYLLTRHMTPAFSRLLASAIIVIMLADEYFSMQVLSDFQIRFKEWEEKFHLLTDDEKAFLLGINQKGSKVTNRDVPPELLEKLGITAKSEHSGYRLLRAFPDLRRIDTKHDAVILRNVISLDRPGLFSRFWQKTKARVKNFFRADEKKEAQVELKLNFYKLFWIFLISGVIGYVLETLFALVTRGVLESRQGVIYGPFNQVYGFGGVLMTLTLLPLAKKRDSVIFIGSAIVGGAFEWVCSFIQEKVFKTVSWEYNEETFSIGASGRTSLVFMLFWGILGVLLMKFILPRIIRFIDRMLKKQGMFLTYVLIVLIVADLGISAVAVHRWSNRQLGIEAQNKFEVFLDKQYPNELMKEIYPSMRFPEREG